MIHYILCLGFIFYLSRWFCKNVGLARCNVYKWRNKVGMFYSSVTSFVVHFLNRVDVISSIRCCYMYVPNLVYVAFIIIQKTTTEYKVLLLGLFCSLALVTVVVINYLVKSLLFSFHFSALFILEEFLIIICLS